MWGLARLRAGPFLLRAPRPAAAKDSILLRQRERHDVVAELRAELAMTASGDDHVLPAIHFVRHWCRLTAGRQAALPQLAASLDVEGAQIVVGGGGDEHEAAARDDRAAHV